MKVTITTCDICGSEDARTLGKDQKVATMNSNVARETKLFLTDGESVSMIALSFAKKNVHKAGSLEDIDLCHACTNALEDVVRKETIALFANAKLLKESKKKKFNRK